MQNKTRIGMLAYLELYLAEYAALYQVEWLRHVRTGTHLIRLAETLEKWGHESEKPHRNPVAAR